MTDTIYLVPPGWQAVASFAAKRGEMEFVAAMSTMALDVAEEVYGEYRDAEIRHVDGLGECWVLSGWDEDEEADADEESARRAGTRLREIGAQRSRPA